MGRNKKYNTKEEKYQAQKRWAMEYYLRNKEISKKKSLERYHKKKNEKNWDI